MNNGADAYTGFAYVYDMFMDNIPYDKWCQYLSGLLRQYGISDGIVADLGCGTGAVTRRLCAYGYDMIGIDSSADMLSIARERAPEQGSILYLEQDIREMDLYGTVAAMVSICDSMNYLLEESDLEQVFRLVNNYLDPGGVFIFDLKTDAYFSRLGSSTFAENRDNASFIWENFYDSDKKINQYDLTVYVSEHYLDDSGEEYDEEPPIFLRFDETHCQRAYSVKQIHMAAEKAGMEFVTAVEAFTSAEPVPDSERLYIVLREKKQEGKYYE